MLFFSNVVTVSDHKIETDIDRLIVDRLPSTIVQCINQGQAAVVGGALTTLYLGRQPLDIDVFVWESSHHKKCSDSLRASRYTETKTGQNYSVWRKEASLDTPKIDLVFMPPSLKAILDRVDFRIRRIAYSKGKLIADRHFLSDLAKRSLIYTGQGFDLYKTALAIGRYKKKGFTITPREADKIFRKLGYRVIS